jgi:phenylacetate-CoA ligase
MEGGILGRIDQMLIVRGVNIFPSAIEAIVRSYPQVQEFAIEVYRAGEMDQVDIKVEVVDENPQAVAKTLARDATHRLGLRVGVKLVPVESLPRFELKARRVVDRRPQPSPDGG